MGIYFHFIVNLITPMHFELEQAGDYPLIQGYQPSRQAPGYIKVADEIHQQSIVIFEDEVIAWQISHIKELDPEHVKQLVNYKADVIILGTGDDLVFPSAELITLATSQQVGLEVMNTHAACGTYNLLLAEGRKVVGALIL